MNKARFNFWIIAIAGTLAFGWMIAELVRALINVVDQAGLSAIVWDGVVHHKVGELLVGIPFVAILALSNVWPKEKVRSLIRPSAVVMVIGGLLNAIAWYTLRHTVAAGEFLRIWCLIIFVFGLTGAWISGRMLELTTRHTAGRG